MKFEEHFIDSLGYEIELISRVSHEVFKRWFENNSSITSDEFVILDMIDCNKNLSQIELANATLKGKAHTGKFLDSLEEKGLITRLYDTKNSRMVKIPVMTDAGKKTYNDLRIRLEEITNKIYEYYPKDKMDELKSELKKLRKVLTEEENISFN